MQYKHIPDLLRRLHEALIDVVGIFNRPRNDVVLLREAGVSLDRALFPLLVYSGCASSSPVSASLCRATAP